MKANIKGSKVTLEMSLEEGYALQVMLNHVGGYPETSIRSYMDDLRYTLIHAGLRDISATIQEISFETTQFTDNSKELLLNYLKENNLLNNLLEDTDSTEKAIEESIEHWKRMKNGADEAPYADECSLCHKFGGIEGCVSCPVALHTGLESCRGSPWEDAFEAFDIYGRDSKEFKEAVKKEIKFLKQVLRVYRIIKKVREVNPEAADWIQGNTKDFEYLKEGWGLIHLFSWIDTPQGHDYWSEINKEIKWTNLS